MDVGALMSRKVYGIPVVWIAAAVAVMALYGAFRLRPTPEPVAEEPTDDEDTAGYSLDFADQPTFSATPTVTQPTITPDTNELWGRRAIEWLTSTGTTLSLATGAISKYLDGEPLSYAEAVARDRAVKQFGIPPEGLPPVTNNPSAPVYAGPATRQGVPPLFHTVKGKSDASTGALARLYYGMDTADTRNLINAHPSNAGKVSPYPVGAKIRVPAYHDPKFFRATSATNTLYAIAKKNGTTAAAVSNLNPGMVFPVKVGTRVRVR